ncbi:hypothetical protein LWI29_006161 [Acer saccharum]|uniref:Uncharacterized protein n=1 Tax=Acer saccharum TaxID=4024 RepID=A0AA39VIF5_ACESA|nr:hypothetical protein LWI29_006161 [Acer saccharum]
MAGLSVAAQTKMMQESTSKTLRITNGPGSPPLRGPLLKGPDVEERLAPSDPNRERVKGQQDQGLPTNEAPGIMNMKDTVEITKSSSSQPVPPDMIISPKKKVNRKWKRSTREGQTQLITGLVSSPIQRVLAAGKAGKKSAICNSSSPRGPKIARRIGKIKNAYDAIDTGGNITIKWDVMSWTLDGYVGVVTIYNFQKHHQIKALVGDWGGHGRKRKSFEAW